MNEEQKGNVFNDKMIPVLRGYLNKLVDLGGSDLHIKALGKVYGRVNGEMTALEDEILS